MGNAQSREAGAPRRFQNKLSKPRTNLTVASAAKLPGTTSRRNSLAYNPPTASRPSSLVVDVRVEDVGNIKEKPKFRRRLSLFRSKISQAKAKQLENDNNLETESLPSHSIGCSRCNSLTFELSADQQLYSNPNAQTRPAARSRMTLQHVPYAQNYSRLSLVPEARSLYPDPTREDGKMLSDNNMSRQFGERTKSDLELYVPIRRRSLLQHGVATRNSFIENTSRQSLPSQIQSEDQMRNYYYNPSRSTSSPLSNLAVLTTGLENTQDMPRTETPDDLHYIGAFKLGTLRITNGAASPVPSDRVATPVDYVSSTPQDSAVILDMRSQPFSTSDSRKAPWTTRTESPLRQTCSELEANELPAVQAPELLFTKPDFSDAHSSLDLAREYIQDMPLSPFSFQDSPPLSPGLQTTSKHMAVEDDLFEIESGTPIELARRPSRSIDSGFQDGISPHSNIALRGSKDLPPTPLTKADSGYSSNASIRSFRRESQSSSLPDTVGPPLPPKEPVSRVPSSTYSITSASSQRKLSSREPLPLLPHDAPEQNSIAQQKPKVLVRTNQSRQRSLSSFAKLVGEGTTPIDSPISENGSSRWRGGWKQRSQSQPPKQVFTVQAMPSDGLFIPPVPADVSRKLEERVDRFPVASFPNTFATTNVLKRTSSKETLGTIFSVGSAEIREEPTYARLQSSLPAIPADAREGEAVEVRSTTHNHRYTYQAPATAADRFPNRQSLPTLPIYRKQLPKLTRVQSQDQFEAQITSYDNISYSLGKSPYDVALPAPPNASDHRAKSLTSQLEGSAAARFAIARSVSQDGELSLRKQRSYSTIAAQDPYSGHFDHNPNSRGSNKSFGPKKYPPQAHRAYSMSSETFSQNDTYRVSAGRIKRPPVSMPSHRQSGSLLKGPQNSPPSGSSPTAPVPSRNTTPTPSYQVSKPERGDQWAAQRHFWSSRRQEAEQDIRRKSIEANAIRRPNSARPISHRGRSPFQQPLLRTHASFEHTEYPYGTGQFGHSQNNYLDTKVGSYDLSYGSANNDISPANEYYEADSSYQDIVEDDFPRRIHQRNNSTSDMLVLDQFAGGLDYGYEPGYGLGGSAGTRNSSNLASGTRKSVDVSIQYGVDFSDVPVFLHRVKVEA